VNTREHWERVYGAKGPTEVSWYAPHLDVSLRIIEQAAPERDSRIIDVGGGEATLVEDLLERGYRHLSVLDISATALDVAKARLGERAGDVDWMIGDATAFPLGHHRYDVWHDRAAFHFLTDPRDRVAYVRQVARAVEPGGHVIVATFGPEGPEPVQRPRRGAIRTGRTARPVRRPVPAAAPPHRDAPDPGRHRAAVHVLLLQDFRGRLTGDAAAATGGARRRSDAVAVVACFGGQAGPIRRGRLLRLRRRSAVESGRLAVSMGMDSPGSRCTGQVTFGFRIAAEQRFAYTPRAPSRASRSEEPMAASAIESHLFRVRRLP